MRDDTILSATWSVCPECLERIPAQRVRRGEDVYLRKACPDHGLFEVVLWRGEPSFQSWATPKPPVHPPHPQTTVEQGCPYDCGLCPDHRQTTCCVLVEVTQRCGLGCPVCFASAGSPSDDPSLDTIRGWYRALLDSGGPYNVQLSGGEPTERDDLPEIVALGRSLGFSFIQLNTNGLRLAHDEPYVRSLKEAGLSTVFLQFDGTDDAIYRKLRGRALLAEKKAAVERCVEHGLGVVLVPTLVPGVNTHDVGSIVRFAVAHSPGVRGVHLQPISYFGRFPHAPRDEDRITLPEVLRELDRQTGGTIDLESIVPSNCDNALCGFHGNYVVMPDGALRAWTKREEKEECCCRPEDSAARAREFVARQWAFPSQCCATTPSGPSLGGWDEFLTRLRTHSFCISGMVFQDAWNLDLERLQDCGLHVLSPDGRIVPFCAYNVTSRSGRSLHRPQRVAAP